MFVPLEFMGKYLHKSYEAGICCFYLCIIAFLSYRGSTISSLEKWFPLYMLLVVGTAIVTLHTDITCQ
jgi:hypothetical protein